VPTGGRREGRGRGRRKSAQRRGQAGVMGERLKFVMRRAAGRRDKQ
jgi:hypothetical protein